MGRLAQFDPFISSENGRYFSTAAGRSRRIADVADHGLGRLNWADSGPSFLASETSADGRPHGHDGRGARGPTKGLAAGAEGLRQEGRPRRGGSLRHVEMVDPHPSSKSSAAEEEGLHADADRRWRELCAAARRRFEQHPPNCARRISSAATPARRSRSASPCRTSKAPILTNSASAPPPTRTTPESPIARTTFSAPTASPMEPSRRACRAISSKGLDVRLEGPAGLTGRVIPMRPSPKSLTRRPINSAAEPHGRTAAGSLDQNDSVATNGPEIGARAAASAPDSTSQANGMGEPTRSALPMTASSSKARPTVR